jgi:hypothetical protein
VITAAAMLAVNFHWLTDAVVGAAIGVLLLGAVHLGDPLLRRRVTARAGGGVTGGG